MVSLADPSEDRIVDGIDILRIATAFASVMAVSPHYYPLADLDNDGDVDGEDLMFVVMAQFGTTCEPCP